jgi:hypothetical protein
MSTGEQNRASAKQAIDMISQAGLVIEPTEVQNFAAGLRADLSSGARMFEDVVGAGRPGFNAAERIEAANGDLATILNVHSGLGTIPPSRGSDYVSAMVARDAIREWVGNLQPNQIIRGDAQFISGMWQHHRDTWRIHSNLEAIRDVTQSADLRRLASGTGANLNTMRQEIRKIIDNDRKARRYSPEAREEMLRVVEGGWIRNLVRQVSKYAPHGPVSGIPTMLGLLSAEPSIGAVIAATGIGGHLLSHLLEASSMRRLDAVIRSASPLTTAGAQRMFQTAPGRGQRRGAAAIRAALDVGAGSALAEPEPQE